MKESTVQPSIQEFERLTGISINAVKNTSHVIKPDPKTVRNMYTPIQCYESEYYGSYCVKHNTFPPINLKSLYIVYDQIFRTELCH